MMQQIRPSKAVVDLSAITHNVRVLKKLAGTDLFCAVVKADGYGHGSVQSARAALRGGATMLAVALVEEAIVLRDAGIDAPVLILSETPAGGEPFVAQHRLLAAVYSRESIDRQQSAAAAAGVTVGLHLKVDTGMHRVGCRPNEAVELVRHIQSLPNVEHVGTFTHFAVADAPELPYTSEQLAKFDSVLSDLEAAGSAPGIVHTTNSAGTIAHPSARRIMVRAGISVYGQAPDLGLDPTNYNVHLRPAIQVVSAVSHVKVLQPGDRASYGLAYRYDVPSVVATVPIGYADGIPRRWSSVGGEVLIGGRRRPIGGRVTMDQIVIDCGPVGAGDPVQRGDEVVLIGSQGNEYIGAWELAGRLDTIAYEITCGLTARLPRTYVDVQSDLEVEPG
jgi:alanine racemase